MKTLSITVMIVFFLILLIFSTIYFFSKKRNNKKNPGIPAVSGGKSSYDSPWKIFWKIVSLGAILGICYGGYLLACYCWPTPERLAFKELSKNLAEIELKPEKDKLAALGAKIKDGKKLTETEKREAMEADEKIRRVRKDYSGGKLVPPPLKPSSAKPKEEIWDWTFEWEATAEQLTSGRQKTAGLINDAQIISCNAKVLKFRYKRPSGKIVNLTLDRDSAEKEYYFGRVAQSDLYLRVWLLPDEKGNFHGQSDNGPGKMAMDIFLKKKL